MEVGDNSAAEGRGGQRKKKEADSGGKHVEDTMLCG